MAHKTGTRHIQDATGAMAGSRKLGDDSSVAAGRAAALADDNDGPQFNDCPNCGGSFDDSYTECPDCGEDLPGTDPTPEGQQRWSAVGVTSIADMMHLEIAGVDIERFVEVREATQDFESPATSAGYVAGNISDAGVAIYMKAGVTSLYEIATLHRAGLVQSKIDEYRKAGIVGYEDLSQCSTGWNAADLQANRKLGFTGKDLVTATALGIADYPDGTVEWARALGAKTPIEISVFADLDGATKRHYGPRQQRALTVSGTIAELSPAQRQLLLDTCLTSGRTALIAGHWKTGERDISAIAAAAESGILANDVAALRQLGGDGSLRDTVNRFRAVKHATGANTLDVKQAIGRGLSGTNVIDGIHLGAHGMVGEIVAAMPAPDLPGPAEREQWVMENLRTVHAVAQRYRAENEDGLSYRAGTAAEMIKAGVPLEPAVWAAGESHATRQKVRVLTTRLGVTDPSEVIRLATS